MNVEDQLLNDTDLCIPCANLVPNALASLTLFEQIDVLKELIEALHSRFGVLELQVLVLFLKTLSKDLTIVPRINFDLIWRLDSVYKLVDSLTSISLNKFALEGLPEFVALVRILILLERNATE